MGDRLIVERLHQSEIHPDSWPAAFIRDPADTEARLAAVAGDKYSYRELDDFTDLMGRTLQGAPEVAKIDRKGVLPEQIFLDYSQQRLAEYGMTPSNLKDILGARNITLPGGQLEVGPQNIQIDPSGKFTNPQQIGDVIIGVFVVCRAEPGLSARPGRHFARIPEPGEVFELPDLGGQGRPLATQPRGYGRGADEGWGADRRIRP